MRNEPQEQHKMAPVLGHADRLQAMRELLDQWLEETNDPQTVFGNPLMLGDEATLLQLPTHLRNLPSIRPGQGPETKLSRCRAGGRACSPPGHAV